MAKHAAGDTLILTGTITEIDGGIALVTVDGTFPSGGTVTMRLGKLPAAGEDDADEDRIRGAMAEAQAHPGRVVTR